MRILPVSMELAKEQSDSFFIELYNIYLKTGIIRICNCDVVINFGGYDYHPVPIERGSIKSTVDAKIDNMDLKISDADNAKVSTLMQGFDFRGRNVEVLRIQYPESLEDNSIVLPVFFGYLDAPSYSNGEFTCSIINSFPKSNLPYRTTQYFCNNTFGDELCGMSKATKEVSIDIGNSNTNTIRITGATLTADYYKNGLITMGYETKLIKSNTSNEITVQYPFLADITDKAVLTRNCDKTPEMCAKFGNRKNYGGFLAIPKEFRVMT